MIHSARESSWDQSLWNDIRRRLNDASLGCDKREHFVATTEVDDVALRSNISCKDSDGLVGGSSCRCTFDSERSDGEFESLVVFVAYKSCN